MVDPKPEQVNLLPGFRVGHRQKIVVGAQAGTPQRGHAKGLRKIGPDVQLGRDRVILVRINPIDHAGIIAGAQQHLMRAAFGVRDRGQPAQDLRLVAALA